MRLAILIFPLLLLFACESSTSNQPDQPNIVFILADDLGYHDLSCMGSSYYETPNIDQIAQRGMIFTNGYATCQVCSPSRASLLTGKFPARHGITDWIGAKTDTTWRQANRFTRLLPPDYIHHLPFQDSTLAEVLRANGYRTFFAGKWHLGNEGSYPEDHGFEYNEGGYERGGPYSGGYFAPFNNPKMEDEPGEEGMSLSMKLAKETNQFIESHSKEPFLAYLSFYAVHAPIQTTEAKWNRYRDKAEQQGINSEGFEMERRLPIRKYQDNPIYAGLIEQMDEAVGSVLQTLDQLNLRENTIVIFTSDNGGVASGDNFSTSNSPLRGGKGYQWEGGIREPYLIDVPWFQLNGQENHTPVSGTDFYPTLLELASIPLLPNQHIDGTSLVPLFRNQTIPERPLYWHYPHYGNQGGDPSSIIRLGDWKLIYYWENQQAELFNLKEDSAETTDVSEKYPEKTKTLKDQLLNWLTSVNANLPKSDPLFDAVKFKEKQKYYRDTLLIQLENRRKAMLEKDWQPNEDWWGSAVEGEIT